MVDRYISRGWLLEVLADYKNIDTWNLDVCDADTVLRVLEVLENKVKGAPVIGPRQLGNKILAAKNVALEVHLKMAKDDIARAESKYRQAESTNNTMFMGFHKGYLVAMGEMKSMLERMLSDG